MGGLRGGGGGGGGGGFEDNESFEAMNDARSDNDGCELFFGGGGGGGDESVGCSVVASIFSLWSCDELCRAARCTATPLRSERASALCSSAASRDCRFDTPCAQAEQWAPLQRPMLLSGPWLPRSDRCDFFPVLTSGIKTLANMFLLGVVHVGSAAIWLPYSREDWRRAAHAQSGSRPRRVRRPRAAHKVSLELGPGSVLTTREEPDRHQ